MSACRSCGAAVVWATTSSGKAAPFTRDDKGMWAIVGGRAELFDARPRDPLAQRHTSHFALRRLPERRVAPEGARVIDEDGAGYVCCGAPMAEDRTTVGETVGGLLVVGGMACTTCGAARIRKGITREARAGEGPWKIAKGGRSLDAGAARVRVEGRVAGAAELIARLAKVPELERVAAAASAWRDSSCDDSDAAVAALCDAIDALEIR